MSKETTCIDCWRRTPALPLALLLLYAVLASLSLDQRCSASSVIPTDESRSFANDTQKRLRSSAMAQEQLTTNELDLLEATERRRHRIRRSSGKAEGLYQPYLSRHRRNVNVVGLPPVWALRHDAARELRNTSMVSTVTTTQEAPDNIDVVGLPQVANIFKRMGVTPLVNNVILNQIGNNSLATVTNDVLDDVISVTGVEDRAHRLSSSSVFTTEQLTSKNGKTEPNNSDPPIASTISQRNVDLTSGGAPRMDSQIGSESLPNTQRHIRKRRLANDTMFVSQQNAVAHNMADTNNHNDTDGLSLPSKISSSAEAEAATESLSKVSRETVASSTRDDQNTASTETQNSGNADTTSQKWDPSKCSLYLDPNDLPAGLPDVSRDAIRQSIILHNRAVEATCAILQRQSTIPTASSSKSSAVS